MYSRASPQGGGEVSRLIVNNTSVLDDETALRLVCRVISGGRISSNEKQYCYLTTFNVAGQSFAVSTGRNKASDKFTVTDYHNGR